HAAALDVAGADVAVVVAQGDGHAPVGVLAGAPVGAQAQADHVGVGARHGGAGVIVLVAVLHRGPAAHATHLAVEVEVAQGLVGEGADVVLVELHAGLTRHGHLHRRRDGGEDHVGQHGVGAAGRMHAVGEQPSLVGARRIA